MSATSYSVCLRPRPGQPDGIQLIMGVAKESYSLTRLNWSDLFTGPDAFGIIDVQFKRGDMVAIPNAQPFGAVVAANQEVWAFGVTYESSSLARQGESTDGKEHYRKVYLADRPEIFFKSSGRRVSAHGQEARIRRDSNWQVPEPEIGMAINCLREIIGYTISVDMSSRDMEGENLLYLSQAKVWPGSCVMGPTILLTNDPLPSATNIKLKIFRGEHLEFSGTTSLSKMRRTLPDLAKWLFCEDEHPNGVLALTGTGIVPPDQFTLQVGDVVETEVDGLGMLRNIVTIKDC